MNQDVLVVRSVRPGAPMDSRVVVKELTWPPELS
jgi:hypothetical protein